MSNLIWSSYNLYEGWLAKGTAPFALPANPTFNDWLLATLTATEGGRYGSLNAYDSCGVSCSLIQVCEFGLYGVSDLLGYLIGSGALNMATPNPLGAALAATNATFTKTAKGAWRFSLPAPFYEVNTKAEQQILFFGAPNVGERGTWTDATKAHAATWVQALSTLLDDPALHAAQNEFCAFRLRSWYDHPFFTGKADTGLMGAVHAAYVSFAANLPAVARSHFGSFLAGEGASLTEGSQAWAEAALRALTFSGIAIWPHRYDAIRPVLEKGFGVDLPDLAADLKNTGGVLSPEKVQLDLIALNYDLGPSGADGVLGPKTRQALLLFQQSQKMSPTGIPDATTCAALAQATAGA